LRDSNNSLFEEALFAPTIPDYQLVRKIGGGAYGQVWMALSVTGAYRAVKIVAREDFRFEKTFEREFEGIKHFEPISRAHSGLVDVLHVGRSFEENFYYYVMELADDRGAIPGVFDPYTYEPRTLRSDMLASGPINVTESIHIGTALAESLHYLHARGLSHRDVKPSNVIFVDGEPKLADIGLVAESGQQTFVGTEGFVPPEGPGTAKADIYSLGMVLYELTTGKDRLDFPELPYDLEVSAADRQDWHALNGIICRCCTADQAQRYQTASDLAVHLAHVQTRTSDWQTRLKQPFFRNASTALLLLAIGLGIASLTKGPVPTSAMRAEARSEKPFEPSPPIAQKLPSESTPRELLGTRMVTTMADDAYFYTKQGREIGGLPLSLNQLGRLTDDKGIVSAPGYGEKDVGIAQLINTKPLDQPISIALSRSPEPQRGWTSPLGIVFRYDVSRRRHLSVWPLGMKAFEQFREQTPEGKITSKNLAQAVSKKLFPGSEGLEEHLVLTTDDLAERFCDWLSMEPESKGWLRENQRYRPIMKPVFTGRAAGSALQLVYCEIANQ